MCFHATLLKASTQQRKFIYNDSFHYDNLQLLSMEFECNCEFIRIQLNFQVVDRRTGALANAHSDIFLLMAVLCWYRLNWNWIFYWAKQETFNFSISSPMYINIYNAPRLDTISLINNWWAMVLLWNIPTSHRIYSKTRDHPGRLTNDRFDRVLGYKRNSLLKTWTASSLGKKLEPRFLIHLKIGNR